MRNYLVMNSSTRLLLSSVLLFCYLLSPSHGADDDNVPFEQNYAPLYGTQNIRVLNQNKEVQLTLNQYSGSGFESLHKYCSGWFSMRIKMPQKDSTAVITTFYLISDPGATRDEIDFELLGGNNKDRRYVLHTNIYTNGQGGREQEIFLWFDPTIDFHNYTLLWNKQHIVFFVDNTPVRVFRNTINKGGSYPTKAMTVTATIWNSTWASNGAPVNWNEAPFEAQYHGFGINACQVNNGPNCNSPQFWWNGNNYWKLNSIQKQAYNNVRSKYLKYDYCAKRIPRPPECNP